MFGESCVVSLVIVVNCSELVISGNRVAATNASMVSCDEDSCDVADGVADNDADDLCGVSVARSVTALVEEG